MDQILSHRPHGAGAPGICDRHRLRWPGGGYPGHGDFDTDEKWTAYLKELAHKFYLANETNEAYPTPEADKWWEWVKEHPFDKNDPDFADRENPYSESMFQEGNRIDEERDKEMREGIDMLKRVFWNLWD